MSNQSKKEESFFSVEVDHGAKGDLIGLNHNTTSSTYADGRHRNDKGQYGKNKFLNAILPSIGYEGSFTLKLWGHEIGTVSASISPQGFSIGAGTANFVSGELGEEFIKGEGKSLGALVKDLNNDVVTSAASWLNDLGFDANKLIVKGISWEGPAATAQLALNFKSLPSVGISAQAAAIELKVDFEHSGGTTHISVKALAGAGIGRGKKVAATNPNKLGTKHEEVIRIGNMEFSVSGDLLPKGFLDKMSPEIKNIFESVLGAENDNGQKSIEAPPESGGENQKSNDSGVQQVVPIQFQMSEKREQAIDQPSNDNAVIKSNRNMPIEQPTGQPQKSLAPSQSAQPSNDSGIKSIRNLSASQPAGQPLQKVQAPFLSMQPTNNSSVIQPNRDLPVGQPVGQLAEGNLPTNEALSNFGNQEAIDVQNQILRLTDHSLQQ